MSNDLQLIAHISKLILLLTFVGLAAVVRFAPAKRRRALISVFLVFLIALNGVVILTGRAVWPFPHYPMMSLDARNTNAGVAGIAFRLVDSGGRERRIDPLSFSPIYPPGVMAWYQNHFAGLSPDEQEIVLQFLFERARMAEAHRRSGRRFGNELLLGPLAAPHTNLYWNASKGMSDPVGLRIYRDSWEPRTLFLDPSDFERKLVAEYVEDRD